MKAGKLAGIGKEGALLLTMHVRTTATRHIP